MASRTLGPSSVSAREQLTRIRRQVEAYIREARQSIWDLRSPILETHDLAAALGAFAKEAIRDKPIRFTSVVTGDDATRPTKVDNQLLRIGQEAITNAVRHAQARASISRSRLSRRSSSCGSKMMAVDSSAHRSLVDEDSHYGLRR